MGPQRAPPATPPPPPPTPRPSPTTLQNPRGSLVGLLRARFLAHLPLPRRRFDQERDLKWALLGLGLRPRHVSTLTLPPNPRPLLVKVRNDTAFPGLLSSILCRFGLWVRRNDGVLRVPFAEYDGVWGFRAWVLGHVHGLGFESGLSGDQQGFEGQALRSGFHGSSFNSGSGRHARVDRHVEAGPGRSRRRFARGVPFHVHVRRRR